MQSYATVLSVLCAHIHWLCLVYEKSREVFHETRPRYCIKKSNEVATDPEFDFSTSGNAARQHVRPMETQNSEGFIDLSETDNKLWMLSVNKLFQVHVIRRRAKVKCFERGQMTHHVKGSQVKS